MRILLLNYEFPPLGGGAGQNTDRLRGFLASAGHQVTVVTSGLGPTVEETRLPDQSLVIRLPVGRRRLYQARVAEMIRYLVAGFAHWRAIVRVSQPEMIVSFFTVPSGILGSHLAKRLGIPHVISLRGMDVPGYDHPHLRLYHYLLGPGITQLWKRADLLIANGKYLARLARLHAEEHLPVMRVIANGVTAAAFSADCATPLPLLAVGRLVPQKNHLLLLRALADPRILQKTWKLTLVGDGPLRSSIQRAIQEWGLQDRVSLTGWLDSETLRRAYERHRIFLHPSHDEACSNSLLEAMAHGLFPIASNAGGNGELIDHQKTGLLFCPGDITVLVDVLDHGLSLAVDTPGDFLRIRLAARERVAQQTDFASAQAYEKALLETLFLFQNRAQVLGQHRIARTPVAAEIDDQGLFQQAAEK